MTSKTHLFKSYIVCYRCFQSSWWITPEVADYQLKSALLHRLLNCILLKPIVLYRIYFIIVITKKFFDFNHNTVFLSVVVNTIIPCRSTYRWCIVIPPSLATYSLKLVESKILLFNYY